MLLGAVADDLTGATDLALTLVQEGMRTLQRVGVPETGERLPGADAVVVALKSRTIPAREAVAQSLASAEVLLAGGARQLFFKYCSTFDSTDEGNIGPVAEALLERVGGGITIACPAFPENGRTVYMGHLFVGSVLLSESPMRDHPLTPMRDANLVRVLQRQTRLRVELVPFPVADAGAEAVRAELDRLAEEGVGIAVTDALTDRHLREIGRAAAELPLVTGASGIARGLPANFAAKGLFEPRDVAAAFVAPPGPAAVIAGSCSATTRAQVRHALEAGFPAFRVDAEALLEGRLDVEDFAARVSGALGSRPVLVYATAEPEEVRRVQERFGRMESGEVIERFLAAVARRLVEAGVRRLVVAGGETAGAVVQALGVRLLEIGPAIDPGVPWTRVLQGPELALALKSGNFGAPDFFVKALAMLER